MHSRQRKWQTKLITFSISSAIFFALKAKKMADEIEKVINEKAKDG